MCEKLIVYVLTSCNRHRTTRRIERIITSSCRVQSVTIASTLSRNDRHISGKMEMDSHADTCVAGKNCIVLNYTDRSCDVLPYSSEYDAVKNVNVVTAATGYTSSRGLQYILVFNEALHMPSLDHTLINPNQLRNHGIRVEDNPYSGNAMVIEANDPAFVMCVQSQGTTIFVDTWSPTDEDLQSLPHIVMTSPHPWNPHMVQFPQTETSVREEIEMHNVSALKQ